MEITGTLINYYFHCKRQCYLFAHRLNLEDNSERVKIGKAIHEEKARKDTSREIRIDSISIDKLTKDYLIETKKSDADINAAKWQLLFYLKVLKTKGLKRKGKLEFVEKNKQDKKIFIFELTDEIENELETYIHEIDTLIQNEEIPDVLNEGKCKKCAYYEYCYI